MKRQQTATCYIVEGARVLLIFHRKFQKWFAPGGHLDPGELPHEGAMREAREETGIEVELVGCDPLPINRPNARSIPRPHLCFLEEIPAHGDEPAHQHVDFIYVGRPVGGELNACCEETGGARWFSLEEAMALDADREIFADTQQVIGSLLPNPALEVLLAGADER